MKNIFHRESNRLAVRLALYVVLVSTFITIFTSAFQLYEIYKTDISAIELRLNEIRDSYTENIASRLWVANKEELEISLQGILRLPDIEHISVYEDAMLVSEVGKLPDTKTIEREYPLTYVFRNKSQQIGLIKITASLKNVYRHIIDQALAIILSNAVKTFLISGFMLYLFYHLVAKHLRKIADYAKDVSITNLEHTLALDRKENDSQHQDEFDLLVDAFATMQATMSKSVRRMQDSEAHYRSLVESSSAIPWTVNADDLCLFYIGPQIKSLFSFPVISWCEEGFWLDRIHSQDRDRVITAIKNSIASQQGCKFDYRLINGSGDSVWIHAHLGGAYVKNGKSHMQGFMFDASEEHSMHEELRENEEFMESILDNMIDGVITIDETGVIQSFNKSAEEMFGYDADDITGKNVALLMSSTTGDMHNTYVSNYIESEHPNVIGIGRDLVAKRKDDSLFPMRISVTELPTTHNGKKWFIGSCVDLTEQRQQEEQLRRSQKMDALGKLTGGIAHDFNNMLNIIMGYAEILRRKLDNEEMVNFVGEIQNAGKRGAALTRKLLLFSSQQAAEERKTMINEVLHDDRNMLQKTLTARIVLKLDLADELWPVFLDKADLEDAILNICINAMHAMPEGGELHISTRNVALHDHKVRVAGLEPSEYVELSITDTGSGMDVATSAKIFDPFFSTKGDKGTGLGMSQVYGFIQRSHGDIKVFSEQGTGTRIVMYFPRYCGEESNKYKNEIELDEAVLQGDETILVVDDEPSLLMLAEEFLGEKGYRVLTSESGERALEILAEEKIDLLISDVIMPGMDGYQLVSKVKELYPDVKLQLASGFTDDKLDHEDSDQLRENLLQKPFTVDELLHRVRTLLDE